MSSIPNFAGKARPPPPRTNTYTSLFFHLSILSLFGVGLASPTYFGNRSLGHYGNRTILSFPFWAITTHCLILLLPYLLCIISHGLSTIKNSPKAVFYPNVWNEFSTFLVITFFTDSYSVCSVLCSVSSCFICKS